VPDLHLAVLEAGVVGRLRRGGWWSFDGACTTASQRQIFRAGAQRDKEVVVVRWAAVIGRPMKASTDPLLLLGSNGVTL
jgi:hypothetical protein